MRSARMSIRCPAGGSGIGRWSPISISFSRSPASAAESAASLSPPEVALPVGTAADEPRAAAVTGRSVASAAADLGHRHRGSLLDRDVDLDGTGPRPADRLAAAVPRRAHHRGRRRMVRRSGHQRVRRPVGLARHPRAGRGARRRQGDCCGSACTCGRPASASSARWRWRWCCWSRPPPDWRCAGRSAGAITAALPLAIIAFARLAHRAGDGDRRGAAIDRVARDDKMTRDALGSGARAADRAVPGPHLRPAQRRPSSSS